MKLAVKINLPTFYNKLFACITGNNSFEALKLEGLTYDCSWPSYSYMNPGLWPYTLDYKTIQDCSVGPCPDASIPGIWIIPMIDWQDLNGVVCSMVDGCTNM